ncbi:YebO family protein [Pectobacterium wasabiae]|uniref:Uncharacterized protein n=1 Tax=Pectobacterium wasabiae TaxID=55208 RepID=A0AAW3EM36_9GAMM|nr:YebO family protein [Pectobacterium wasabiae]AOR64866.1 hypothetical protein A7983_16710 [Pectobacterium wasabiae CFBP 3304]EJS96289.1 Hypothetical protein Y17_0165 [Pectobacterium wasabiae CFBP 3304]KFX09867.1 hypothetical protein JV38_02795 [Pectobacterium wasabiae]KGA30069.1 hypothetical protein KU73_06520 [Pectobacterium wasabiae]
MSTSGWIIVFLVARVIDLFIWYLLNRSSVRANEQIKILQEINEKQSAQLELLTSIVHKKDGPEKDYLEEARRRAGLTD